MKTQFTCHGCMIKALVKNKTEIKEVTVPGIQCSIRDDCPDDASTTDKRKQTLTPWPEIVVE